MRAVYIIAGVLLALWLISLIRVGGIVEYSAEGVLARLRLGPVRVELFPGKPKKEKPPKHAKKKKKKEKVKPEREPVPLTEKVGGALSLFQELLPVALELVGKLLRKLRVDELVLHLTWAARDPASAAIGYGAAQAALGSILALLERGFDVRELDAGVAVDFTLSQPVIYARGSLSFTVGQLTALGAVGGVKALAAYLRVRRARPKRKKAPPAQKTVDTAVQSGDRKEGTLS